MSGYQDSNLGPPAPKAGALTGLRYTPFLQSLYFRLRCKGKHYLLHSKHFNEKYSNKMHFKEDIEKNHVSHEKKQQNYLQFKN